jgi:4-hydroxythreonine-4-phosphate dehydrogenase
MPTALVLTIGHGIGPEITARFLQQVTATHTVYVVGHTQAVQALLPHNRWPDWAYPVPIDGSAGDRAYHALAWAVQAIADGTAQGLVTGPISKAALWSAGYTYHGHTELLADLAQQHWPGSYTPEMLFVYQQFRLLLLTRHVPLAQVSAALTQAGVTQALTTLITFLQQHVGITHPRLAILGVNPHAGEIGGTEEIDVLQPACQHIQQMTGAICSQPLAADGFFRGFDPLTPGVDAVIAPYHDQGLIPFKLLAGWQAVNVTLGLPFLRTSVSHGTAPDIVGHQCAKPDSLLAAYDLLCQWTRLQL